MRGITVGFEFHCNKSSFQLKPSQPITVWTRHWLPWCLILFTIGARNWRPGAAAKRLPSCRLAAIIRTGSTKTKQCN